MVSDFMFNYSGNKKLIFKELKLYYFLKLINYYNFFKLPMVRIDSLYYGRLVVAPINIVMYNVFSKHGSELYGVEPWYFYLLNGFLNFNFIFLSALFTPFALVCSHLFVYYILPSLKKDFLLFYLIAACC